MEPDRVGRLDPGPLLRKVDISQYERMLEM